MRPLLISVLKRVVPIVFYALLVIFLILYVRTIDFAKLTDIDINWFFVGLSTLFSLGFIYWGAYIWTVLLRSLGASDVRLSPALLYVYAKSWLGRYIPGTAPWILGKIYFAARHGISKNKLAVSSLLEGGLQIIVVMLLASILLLFDSRLNIISGGIKLAMLAVILMGIITLIPPVFNRFVSLAYRLIRKKPLDSEHFASTSTIVKGAGLYVIGAIINGIGFCFIAKAVYPELDVADSLFVVGSISLAGAASMLAIFAPSGIGVREGILLVLLGVIMPAETALVVTVFTRLWSVVSDFLFFAICRILVHKK